MTGKPVARMMAAAFAVATICGTALADRPRVIALQYDDRLRKVGFASPFLVARAAGRTIRFIMDTGAGEHVLAKWFVKAAGLNLKAGEPHHVGGFSGNSVDMAAVENITVVLSAGDTLNIDEAVVTDLPHEFEQNAIAGILSPQLLASQRQVAVLDLPRPELRLEPMQAALDRLHGRVLDLGGMTRVCIQSDTAPMHRIYTMRTTVEGVETSLVVDTGAATTSLVEGTPPARAAARYQSKASHDEVGVDGQRVHIIQTTPINLDFGGGVQRLAVGIGPTSAPCASQGGLGMDALKACRWILAPSAMALSCPQVSGTP